MCVLQGGGAAEAASAPDAGPNTVGSSASERTGAAAACGSTTAPAVPGETQAALPAAPHNKVRHQSSHPAVTEETVVITSCSREFEKTCFPTVPAILNEEQLFGL